MRNNYQYGYMNGEKDERYITQKPGQIIGGFPIGIIYIADLNIPVIPGNTMNGYTYQYPVHLAPVRGMDNKAAFAGSDAVYPAILEAVRECKSVGARAVTGACGFFGNFQNRLSREKEFKDMMISMSSLMQLPLIASAIKPYQKIGVLTANGAALTADILTKCGIAKEIQERLVIRGLENEKEFNTLIVQSGSFSNAGMKEELIAKAMEIMECEPEIGAFLLECTEMPPYAHVIADEVQCPVFDFTTMVDWMYSGVCRRPFYGFI